MVEPRLKSDKLRFDAIQKHITGKKILDIGSTEGYVHKLLKEFYRDGKVYSLDNSGSADYNLDLDKPSLLKDSFSTIIAGEVIEHLRSPLGFIEFCSSILEKNGRLILTTPNSTGLQYLLDPSWCVNYTDYRGHTQSFTIPMIKRMCKDSGLDVIYAGYLNAFWKRNPLQLISLTIPRLRPDLIVVAVKQ